MNEGICTSVSTKKRDLPRPGLGHEGTVALGLTTCEREGNC